MRTAIEPDLHWTHHYVKYGFAVVPGLLDPSFCEAALNRVREIIHNDLPFNEWTEENTPTLYRPYYEGGNATDPVFDKLFEQPKLLRAIDELFGRPNQWNGIKGYYLMVRGYNAKAKQELAPKGHIDFPAQGVPILYRGFVYQASLVDTEPFSGNFTVFPGTHVGVQRLMMDEPNLQFSSGLLDVPTGEPFEFVAKAGDVCFFHHLVLHSGNVNHADNRSPRIALMGEAFRDEWLREVDPATPGLGPWERSLALNGPVRPSLDVEQTNMKKRADYIAELLKKETQPVAAAT